MDDVEVTVGPWRRLRRVVAYENTWIEVRHDDVVRPDGQVGVYGVVHPRNVAAGVVALDADDNIVLVGQHRYTLDAWSWEIPEGGVPHCEDLLDGIKRELREETGLLARSWRHLVTVHLSNSVVDERAELFVATDLAAGVAEPEGTEELEVRWVRFTDAVAMTLDGRITDAMSVVALQRVALERAGLANPGPSC